MTKMRRTLSILGVVVLVSIWAAFSFWLWLKVGPTDSKVLFDGYLGAIVGSLTTATVTLVLVYVALAQLRGVAQTASADFILRRADQFFRSQTRILFHLVEDKYLAFEAKDPFRDSFFQVDEKKLNSSGLYEDIKKSLLKKPA